MLWKASEITGYGIEATDGAIGSIDDLLVDDVRWAVRWLVVDTGNWLPGRKVLLPPSSLQRATDDEGRFPVSLSRQQVKDSPDVDVDAPVSRQHENTVYEYYGWEPYWLGSYPVAGLAGVAIMPPMVPEAGLTPTLPETGPLSARSGETPALAGDPHLRSAAELHRYAIHASDGDIGHVSDFLVDDADWSVRYLVVNTGNWWPGKHVLISAGWTRGISWEDAAVRVDLTRQTIKDSPEYDERSPIERGYEEQLHAHYGEPGYWPGPV